MGTNRTRKSSTSTTSSQGSSSGGYFKSARFEKVRAAQEEAAFQKLMGPKYKSSIVPAKTGGTFADRLGAQSPHPTIFRFDGAQTQTKFKSGELTSLNKINFKLSQVTPNDFHPHGRFLGAKETPKLKLNESTTQRALDLHFNYGIQEPWRCAAVGAVAEKIAGRSFHPEKAKAFGDVNSAICLNGVEMLLTTSVYDVVSQADFLKRNTKREQERKLVKEKMGIAPVTDPKIGIGCETAAAFSYRIIGKRGANQIQDVCEGITEVRVPTHDLADLKFLPEAIKQDSDNKTNSKQVLESLKSGVAHAWDQTKSFAKALIPKPSYKLDAEATRTANGRADYLIWTGHPAERSQTCGATGGAVEHFMLQSYPSFSDSVVKVHEARAIGYKMQEYCMGTVDAYLAPRKPDGLFFNDKKEQRRLTMIANGVNPDLADRCSDVGAHMESILGNKKKADQFQGICSGELSVRYAQKQTPITVYWDRAVKSLESGAVYVWDKTKSAAQAVTSKKYELDLAASIDARDRANFLEWQGYSSEQAKRCGAVGAAAKQAGRNLSLSADNSSYLGDMAEWQCTDDYSLVGPRMKDFFNKEIGDQLQGICTGNVSVKYTSSENSYWDRAAKSLESGATYLWDKAKSTVKHALSEKYKLDWVSSEQTREFACYLETQGYLPEQAKQYSEIRMVAEKMSCHLSLYKEAHTIGWLAYNARFDGDRLFRYYPALRKELGHPFPLESNREERKQNLIKAGVPEELASNCSALGSVMEDALNKELADKLQNICIGKVVVTYTPREMPKKSNYWGADIVNDLSAAGTWTWQQVEKAYDRTKSLFTTPHDASYDEVLDKTITKMTMVEGYGTRETKQTTPSPFTLAAAWVGVEASMQPCMALASKLPLPPQGAMTAAGVCVLTAGAAAALSTSALEKALSKAAADKKDSAKPSSASEKPSEKQQQTLPVNLSPTPASKPSGNIVPPTKLQIGQLKFEKSPLARGSLFNASTTKSQTNVVDFSKKFAGSTVAQNENVRFAVPKLKKW